MKVVGYGRNIDVAAPVERDWHTPRYLFVGKDWDRKNGAAVVRAFRRLRRDIPEAELHLEGLHPPVDEEGVTGHGRLNFDSPEGNAQLRSLFARATCFVVPSKIEPFGIVYIEAAAAGLPSIGTSVGGTATSIGDGGITVDPRDDAALYEAMCRLADPETARSLGAVAYRAGRELQLAPHRRARGTGGRPVVGRCRRVRRLPVATFLKHR